MARPITVNHFTLLSILFNLFGVEPDEGAIGAQHRVGSARDNALIRQRLELNLS
jgi:hypothetical protein